MKKNLVIFVIAALIFTHIIPPHNISFANDEVNQCEMMSFSVQTIIEDDKRIVGTGFPSDQLTIEFLTKNKTDITNVDSSGNFELSVEEGFLELDDTIIISNEYFKVETSVVAEETTDSMINASQYVECPVIEEVEEENDEAIEETEADENLEEVEEISEEGIEETKKIIEEISSEENNDKVSETEIVIEDEKIIKSPLSDEKKMETRLSINEISINQTSGLLNVDLLDDATLTAKIETSAGGKNEIVLNYTGNGLLNVSLLDRLHSNFYIPMEIAELITKDNLSASYNVPGLGLLGIEIRNRGTFRADQITLNGRHVQLNTLSLLSLSLLTRSNYSYELRIELDDLPPTNDGEYIFNSWTQNQLIDLSILSSDNSASAVLEAPKIPTKPVINEPIYTTSEQVTGTGEPSTNIIIKINNIEYRGVVNEDGNYSISIPRQEVGTEVSGVIENSSGHQSEERIVTVIQMLDPPEIDDVFSNDTEVTGTGQANTNIILSIGNETYEGIVDSNGEFSVTIPRQVPGTIIYSHLTDEFGSESESSETLVKEATISFNSIPDNIIFETTQISSKAEKTRIPRIDPNWSLEVIDTRGYGSDISIHAELESPLSTRDQTHVISDGLVYVDENLGSRPLSNESIEVFNGTTLDTNITSLSWPENQGILMEVNLLAVQPEEYTGVINWTIIDGP